jgi:hypothetical protein
MVTLAREWESATKIKLILKGMREMAQKYFAVLLYRFIIFLQWGGNATMRSLMCVLEHNMQ